MTNVFLFLRGINTGDLVRFQDTLMRPFSSGRSPTTGMAVCFCLHLNNDLEQEIGPGFVSFSSITNVI